MSLGSGLKDFCAKSGKTMESDYGDSWKVPAETDPSDIYFLCDLEQVISATP